jgi:hypothetical protein
MFVFTFLFQFKNLPYADTFDKTLMFTIFDYDRFSKHDRIGEVGAFFNVHCITFTSNGLIISTRKYGVYLVVTVIKACYSPKNRCGNYDVNVLNNDGTNFHVKLRKIKIWH